MQGITNANPQWPFDYHKAAALGYIKGASTFLNFGSTMQIWEIDA